MATHMTTFDPTDQFIHAELTRIEGRPDWFGLSRAFNQLKSNARQIESANGNGTHGHLRVCYSLADYNALPSVTNTPWVDPVNPGATPTFANNATTAQINRAIHTYNNARNNHLVQRAVDKALMKQLMAAVDETYFQVLNDPVHGYADIRLIDLMDHLKDTYGAVTEDMVTTNEANMKKKWSPSQPLEDLWKQITDAKAFAEDHDPITDKALVRAAINNLEASGVFNDGLKAWRKKAANLRTWANVKTHFNEYNVERIRSKTTGEFAALVDQKCESADSILAAILSGKHHPLLNKENMPQPMYYCWTHGLGHNSEHTGYTCKSPQEGHRKEANQYNMMGGCNIIHRLKDEKRIWKPRNWRNNTNGNNDTQTNTTTNS